jgi:cyclic-di-GMP-binding protein
VPIFNLPDISADAHPEFTDAKGCGEWLQALSLINIGPSHGQLLGQIEELNCCNVQPAERLKILELLREPIMFVQKEHAKKFFSRPVPLSRQEREIFRDVVALWDAFSQGYQHCLQAIADDASGLSGSVALICQRVLWCSEQRLMHHYEIYQELVEDDWRLLHRAFAFAEERNVADDKVGHPVNKSRGEASCTCSYAHALLLNLANPNELMPRQLALLSRWIERWAPNAAVARTPPDSNNGIAPLIADLASGAGIVRDAAPGDTVRYIHIDDIATGIRKRIHQLQQGASPAELGLGEEVAPSLAENLLVMVYRQWCEDKQSRVVARRSASGTAQVCLGLGAIHHYVTGRPFRQPGEGKELSKIQHEEIATFGRIATHQDDDDSMAHGFGLETWQIKEESLSGLRLERLDPAAVSRLQLNQLFAVRPADAKSYFLGILRWLSVSPDFELRAGVRTIPGVPSGVTIRATGLNTMAEKYVPALMLPAVAALQSPDTLVLPAGWFKPKRVIEIYTDRAYDLMLMAMVERGVDFERVTFEPV